MMQSLARYVRAFFTEPDSRYVFRRADQPPPPVDRAHLYIHVPFCKNLCPYCPYYKVPYDAELVAGFVDALLREIDLYARRLGGMTVPSVYFGGGTPTLLAGELGAIVDRLRSSFCISGPIAIETNPADVSPALVNTLRRTGFNLISLGVQSFDARYLRFIGRPYPAEVLPERIGCLMDGGFESVNLDLMFALPNQPVADLEADLAKADATGAHQVTAYPLFTFPYSAVGRHLRLKNVRMPDLLTRREHYYHLHRFFSGSGYEQISVWGFRRGTPPHFSSVTRDTYVGLGPGAATCVPGGFHFNTFSLDAYEARLADGRLPAALHMPMNGAMERHYWLYWRLYETVVPKVELNDRFGRNDVKLNALLDLLLIAGMMADRGETYELTTRGAFWVHWLQNYFILPSIDKLWGAAMKTPFPAEVRL